MSKNSVQPVKPLLGISQCLTNSIVRYDAKSQFNAGLVSILEQHFKLMPVCPEVECGLSVPRPPVQLVEFEEGIKVIGRDDKTIDVTDKLNRFSKEKILSLSHLSGFIFKARSPSCGVNSVPVFNQNGQIIKYSNGVFAGMLKQTYPAMPVVEDALLDKKENIDSFIAEVVAFSQAKGND